MRDDLRKAINDAVPRIGRAATIKAIKKASGADLPSRVPEDKIDAVIAELRSLPAASAAQSRGTLQHIHARMTDMATSIFGQKGSQ